MEQETVVLLGDDILDDHDDSYTVPSLKKSMDVRSLLLKKFQGGSIQTCSVSSSIIAHVSETGIWPPSKLTDRRKDAKMPLYPVDPKDGRVYPLRFLEKYKPRYAILSIGWNDVKLCFSRNRKPKEVRRMLRDNGFRKDLERCVREVTKRAERTILVFPNLPRAVRMNTMYVLPTMKDMQTIASDVMNDYTYVSKKFKIPIVDLSRTINPYQGSLYRSDDPTRLSTKAREHVANILGYVIKTHKFETDESVIYSGCGPFRSDRNSDGTLSSSMLEHYLFECKSTSSSKCVLS